MPFQGRHVETGSLIGSWPILPSVITGSTVLLPRTMQSKATILGIKREPAAGYDVDGRSFILNVDGVDKNISFSYGGLLPLSVVISQINSDTGLTVAFNDNGFLKLQSPTAGGSSYLKVKVDASSTPTNVHQNLGLFPETEAYAGDLTQAQHVDPDRQVATPGQMTMGEGENFEARVFNRAIAQLSVNNDRNEGILSKKRLAVRDTYTVGSYSIPGAVHGVQITGSKLIYVGKTASPSQAALEKLFAVLDGEGRELSKDLYFPSATGWTGNFYTDTVSGRQICQSGMFSFGEPSEETGNFYLLSNTFTGGATVLNGKPLKIIEVRQASNEAVIENVDPATGQRVAITDAGISITGINRNRAKVVVDGVFENVTTAAAGTPRLEQTQVTKRTGVTPTRVDLGNRIVCVGQDFNASVAIKVGDIITWSGSTISTPFNNNGDYRVDKIIDKETLQVVASDWSAAILNPNTSGGSVGTIAIKTDGTFVLDPFLRFVNNNFNPPPSNGDAVEVAFFSGTTFRQATEDNPAFFQGDVRFTQEADETLARAITRMWGPSVTSLDGVLYNDYRINLESAHQRLNFEHYNYDDAEKTGSLNTDTRSVGRHKDIRPDTIDMWYWTPPDLSTPRVALRGYGLYGRGNTNTDRMDTLVQVIDSVGVVNLQIDGAGRLSNVQDLDTGLGTDNRVWMDMQFNNSRAYTGSPGSLPVLGNLFVSGERIIQRFKHRWYNSLDSGATLSLIGADFITDMELTSNGAQKFTDIIGQRIAHNSTVNNIVGAQNLKWIELTGTLDKGINQADDEDSYTTVYGIHYKPTLAGNIKIFTDHYGLKIEDITRAGTGFASGTAYNYAVYTGAGINRFGDVVYAPLITPSVTASGSAAAYFQADWQSTALTTVRGVYANATFSGTSSVVTGYGLQAELSRTVAGASTALAGVSSQISTVAGGTVATLYGYQLQHGSITSTVTSYYSYFAPNSTFAATNKWGLSLGTMSGGSTANYGIEINNVSGTSTNNFGINIGTVAGSTTNNYGINIGIVSGATTNYSIRTLGGIAWHQDGVSPVALQPATLRVARILSASPGADTAGAVVSHEWSYASTDDKTGLHVRTNSAQTTNGSYEVHGILIETNKSSTGGTFILNGLTVNSTGTSTGVINTRRGIYIKAGTSASNITDWYGVYLEGAAPTTSSGTYGFRMLNMTGTGGSANYGILLGPNSRTGTTSYGLYIDDITGATTNYNIWAEGGNKSVLKGPLYLGTATVGDERALVSSWAFPNQMNSGGGVVPYSFTSFHSNLTGTFKTVVGLNATTQGDAISGNWDDLTGASIIVRNSAGATATNITGLTVSAQSNGGTTTSMYGIRITQPSSSSAVTTLYGLYVDNVIEATTNYSLYTNTGQIRLGSASSDECFVLGARDIGTTTTSALFINTSTGQLGLNSSSIRVKDNVVDLGDTSWLYDTRPVRFNFKGSGELSYGLIAEELIELAPDLVYMRPPDTRRPVGVSYTPQVWERLEKVEGSTYARDIGGIHYDRFVPVLINELKKLRDRVAQLEAA